MPIPFRLDYVIARLAEPTAPSPRPPDPAPQAVARLLGLTRAQLRSRLEKYGLTEG